MQRSLLKQSVVSVLLGICLETGCTTSPSSITIINTPPSESPATRWIFLAGEGQTEEQARLWWHLPDEIEVREAPSPRWNASAMDRRDDTDDTAQFIDLADEAPLVLLGHGNGASMAWRIACAHPTAVRAIVMLAGSATPDDPACGTVGAFSTLNVHGTLDDIVPYSTAWPTFGQAQMLARCTKLEQGNVYYDLGVPVDAFSCLNTEGRGIVSAEHWRAIGWGHAPTLPDDWWPAISGWIDLRL
jgi:polyhydroxybutyrate depolymerase